jgi:hypothetical protein
MLSRVGLPDELWAEAANYANYIRERVLKRTPDGVSVSPYERRQYHTCLERSEEN